MYSTWNKNWNFSALELIICVHNANVCVCVCENARIYRFFHKFVNIPCDVTSATYALCISGELPQIYASIYRTHVSPSYDYICNGELKIITIVADYNDRIAIVVISSKFPENYCISSRKMDSHEKCHREPLSSLLRVQNESESEMGREKRQMHISIEPCANLIISRTWFQDVHKMWRHSFTHIYSDRRLFRVARFNTQQRDRTRKQKKKEISPFFLLFMERDPASNEHLCAHSVCLFIAINHYILDFMACICTHALQLQ